MRAKIAALTVTFAAFLAHGSGPAHALSCVAHPDGSPQAIAAGTEQLAGGGAFFDSYDFALIGTVTAVRTDEREGSPTYGATEIDVAVDGVLGVASAPASITLSAGDPGWMVGYPFELGAAYFVPVDAISPEGHSNWTFACDPISEVADPDATVAELAALVDGPGYALGLPSLPAPGDGPPASSDGSSWFVPVTTTLAVVATAVTALVLLRRPNRVPIP